MMADPNWRAYDAKKMGWGEMWATQTKSEMMLIGGGKGTRVSWVRQAGVWRKRSGGGHGRG